MSENETYVVTVTASDPGGEALSYNLVGEDAAALNISNSGEIIFNSPPDFETKTTYSVIVRVSNNSRTTSQSLTINITDVAETSATTTPTETTPAPTPPTETTPATTPSNTAPTISGLASSISVPENQTSVVTVSASDQDGDALSYSLSGADENFLNIDSSGVLTFTTAPDYESKNTFFVTIKVSDGIDTISQDLIISISDEDETTATTPVTTTPASSTPAPTPSNSPPSISGLVSISVAENQTSVVNVSASDPEGDALSYSLSGPDASSFTVSDTGVISFNNAPDYEVKSNYSLTVNVSDGTETTSQTISVSITDVVENVAPTISGLSSTVSVPENQTSVTTVVGLDSDGDTLTYSLSGTDYLSLSISTSGVITFNNSPTFSNKSSYSLVVTVSDGIVTTSQELIINITSSPIFSGLSSSISVDENQTSIVTATAVTEGEGANLTYSLSGTDVDSFSIDSSGKLTFISVPDFETKSSYSITVSVSDGYNSASENLSISINDVFEQGTVPVIVNLASSISVQENQTNVTTVSASDPDGDSISFSLSGVDQSSFSIDSVGVITFNSAPDYENKTSYSITVEVNDGINQSSKALTVLISNVNDNAPVFSATYYAFQAEENQTSVGTVTASDEDGDVVTYSIGNKGTSTDSSYFSISSLGVITFNSAPDRETGPQSYPNMTVTVSDGTFEQTVDLIVDVLDINEYPVINNLPATYTLDENGTNVLTVSATDPEGDSLFYSLTGADSSYFNISSSGVITFKTASDYETKSSYSITVKVVENATEVEHATTQDLTIILNDLVNENPPELNSNWVSPWKSVGSGSGVDEGTISFPFPYTVTDADGDNIVFAISGNLDPPGNAAQEDDTLFSIDSNTGMISFNSPPDYELPLDSDKNNIYEINIMWTDRYPDWYSNMSLSVRIADIDDYNEIVIFSSSASVPENQTSALTLDVSYDDEYTLSYSLGGTDASYLSVSNSGVITFDSAPDYETKTSYEFYVDVSDGTLSYGEVKKTRKNISISITNVVEETDAGTEPIITNLASTISVAENQTSVVTVSASDPNGSALTYTLSGADASSLSISNSGDITFNSAPNYTTKNSYSITVNVNDGTFTTSQDLTINITEGIPVISNLPTSVSVNENQSSVLTVSASSPSGTSLNYSLTGTDSSSLTINSSGEITFNSPPDYETKTSYEITVKVNSLNNSAEASQDLIININNLNDNDPVFSGFQDYFYQEGGSDYIGQEEWNERSATTNIVLVFCVADADKSDATHSDFTITASGADGGDFYFENYGVNAPICFSLHFSSSPDYETKDDYLATINASDGTNSVSQDIRIRIKDVAENPPSFTSPTIAADGDPPTISVNENQTSVMTVTASDPEGDPFTFSLSRGDTDALTIDSSSGVLTFNSPPDYETKNRYQVSIRVEDVLFYNEIDLVININNVNESSPVINSLASNVSAAEDQTSVVTVSASDADGEALTYTLSGTDASSLAINNSGVITFNTAPVYASKNSYSVTVNVSDGENTTSQNLTVNITEAYANGTAGSIYTSWTHACHLTGPTGYVVKSQEGEWSSPFYWGSSVNENQPWSMAITFKRNEDLNNQRLVQISDPDGNGGSFKNYSYIDINNSDLEFKYGKGASSGLVLNAPGVISRNTWYGLYIDYDGVHGINGANAFRVYLVNLSNGVITDIGLDQNWSGSDDGINNNFSSNFYSLGTDNFTGTVATFVLTTGIYGTTTSNKEIRTMIFDPVKWLQDYKVGKSFRTAFNIGVDGNTTIESSFNLNEIDEDQATQVYLFGSGTNDSVASGVGSVSFANQVNPNGSNVLAGTGQCGSFEIP
tara:strand:- start:321 stop:5798 length:5478 start_codon:yes stop_codon:yes gene_type:complete